MTDRYRGPIEGDGARSSWGIVQVLGWWCAINTGLALAALGLWVIS